MNITQGDISILKEIGNIGSGNAATALSSLLNKKILLDVPEIEICDLTSLPEFLGGADKVKNCILLKVFEDLKGYILFLLDDKGIDLITKIVTQGYAIDTNSVILEIANIITGSYVSALATMTNKKIDITPPQFAHDMIGSMVDGVVSILSEVADESAIIKSNLIIDGETISCNYVFLLERSSMFCLLEYFDKYK